MSSNNNNFSRSIIFAGTLGAIVSILTPFFSKENESLVLILSVALSLFFSVFIFLTLRTLQKNPTTYTISLLGFPRSGKTVYLTILFDFLQRDNTKKIYFSPYGSETIERVFSDLNTLSKGEWLAKTKMNEVFFYRAFATTNSLPIKYFKKKYKLEIADFAGENFDELNPSTEKWLHKSDYFQYVIQSDAVIFAIDVSELIFPNDSGYESIQNSFIAALQILIEKKGVKEDQLLKAPVSLIFLKSDLIKNVEEEREITEKMSRLISICKKRCQRFQFFFVSSTGLTVNGSPPQKLKPSGITSPIKWVLLGK